MGETAMTSCPTRACGIQGPCKTGWIPEGEELGRMPLAQSTQQEASVALLLEARVQLCLRASCSLELALVEVLVP